MKASDIHGGRVRRFRLGASLALSVLLAGCAGVFDRFGAATPASPQPAERFALPPAGSDLVGALQVTSAMEDDTLPDIARRYNLGYEEIVAANPEVDPWLPRAGTAVVLPTEFILPGVTREGLVLNLASMRLFYFPAPAPGQSAEVVTYPIGIGREGWETPLGESRIVQKTASPAWTVPASVRREHAAQGDPLPAVVPPGPDNPLGDYAMRLSVPSYLIHGTNKPWGVGMRVSHGCVRLYPEDIARLFPEVPLGTPVRIINEPYLAGWRDGQLYLEAHPPLAEDGRSRASGLQLLERVLAAGGISPDRLDREKAERVLAEARGLPTPVLAGSPELAEQLARMSRVTSTPPWAPADYAADTAR